MWTRLRAATGQRATAMRIGLLLVAALVGPWLMGAMAATPTDQVELSGQTGSYVFTPVCSSRAMQVKHSEGQLRWTHRTPPQTVMGGTVVTHLDLYASRNDKTRTGQTSGNQSQNPEDEEFELLLLGRGQVGIDWWYFGFRLGIAGGMWWEEKTVVNQVGVLKTEATQDFQRALPAFSLRMGSQRFHVRAALGDGTWQLRPTDMTLGLGFGDGGNDRSVESDVRTYIGFGGDMVDASSDPFFYAGARMKTETMQVGLQGRVGPDGWAGGLWMGIPL